MNQANAKVNIEVAGVVIDTAVDYVADNADVLLENQIEIFRRGTAGEPLVTTPADIDPATVPEPNEWAEIWDETDVYTAEFPRAYVIPVDDTQRSATDAATLVDQLIANGVEVSRAEGAFTADGVEYAEGSYVIDMHQPLRGMANVLLADGSDISERVPDMYDISAWSLALLWGADVEAVGSTTDSALDVELVAGRRGRPHGFGAGRGLVPRARRRAASPSTRPSMPCSTPVSRCRRSTTARSSSATTPRPYDAAAAAAEEFGVTFTASDGSRLAAEESTGLDELTGRLLRQPGRTRHARQARLRRHRAGDVGEPHERPGATRRRRRAVGRRQPHFSGAQAAGRAEVAAYLADRTWCRGQGHGDRDASRTRSGSSPRPPRRARAAPTASSRSTDVDGGLLSTYPQDTAFGYPAVWYSGLGANAVVEQRYAADDPFVSGHWASTQPGRTIADAAGQASVVSAESAAGSKVLMFGTSLNFRTHPVGGFSQLARGLFWAGTEGAEVPAP